MNFLRGRFWYSSICLSICACRRRRGEREIGEIAAGRLRRELLGPARALGLRRTRIFDSRACASSRCCWGLELAHAALRVGEILAGPARFDNRQRRFRAPVLIDVAAAVEVGLREHVRFDGLSRVFALTSTTSSGVAADFQRERRGREMPWKQHDVQDARYAERGGSARSRCQRPAKRRVSSLAMEVGGDAARGGAGQREDPP